MRLWPKRAKDNDHLKSAQEGLASARKARSAAEEARTKQSRLREQESEALIARLDRLAGEDSNHLGALVLEALTEKYHRKEDQ